jgi:hypothetical protein
VPFAEYAADKDEPERSATYALPLDAMLAQTVLLGSVTVDHDAPASLRYADDDEADGSATNPDEP